MARQYTLRIVSAGEATIDGSNSQLTVIIASSDNPHGIVSFMPPLTTTTTEDIGTLSVVVSRTAGLVGDLIVNFTIQNNGAVMPNDYTITNNSEFAYTWYKIS